MEFHKRKMECPIVTSKAVLQVDGWNFVGVIAWIISVIISFVLQIDYLGIVASAIIYALIEHFVPSLSRENKFKEAKNE